MKYAIVTVPAAPVRKKANHRAEMSNQLLFGEAVKILKEKKEKWLKVKSLYDGYTGWITNHLVVFTTEEIAQQPVIKITTDFLNSIKINDAVMNIPAGAHLFQFDKKRGGIDGFEYEYDGTIIELQKIKSKSKALITNAHKWLNAPYMWGGKTILGVDCSGFAQIMYRLVGIPIPRDAWQQARKGEFVKNLAEAHPGDLAFFDDKDEITHVGILLGTDKIIHSAGKVRIDSIDEKGITNCDTGKRTHRLKLIKRFLQ
jgi:hypothetical protein